MTRQTLIFILLLISPLISNGQRLVYKEKVPPIVTTSLVLGEIPTKGIATYIDFFILSSPQNHEQLRSLHTTAEKYKGKVNFILLTKEDTTKVKEYFEEVEINFSIYYDKEGTTFKNFGVKFIPFAVLIDKKGNFIWQGKNTTLTDQIIEQVI